MLYTHVLRPLFWPILFGLAIFTSCQQQKTYFTLTDDGYQWESSPSVENETQYLALQHDHAFMLAKNSVNDGLTPIFGVIAVDQTLFDSAGIVVNCLAFKVGINYDVPWQVITYNGRLIANEDANLNRLPEKIFDAGDMFRTNDGVSFAKK